MALLRRTFGWIRELLKYEDLAVAPRSRSDKLHKSTNSNKSLLVRSNQSEIAIFFTFYIVELVHCRKGSCIWRQTLLLLQLYHLKG